MNLTDIEHYFADNNFMESLVLEYIYDPSAETVTLICDYANDALMALLRGEGPPLRQGNEVYHRDFRRLVFSGIHDYDRNVGTSEALRPYQDNYSARLHRRSVVIQGLTIRRSSGREVLKAKIYFGDFGSCTFGFASLQVDRKLARSPGKRPDAEEWDYIDISTMEPLDFYSPFEGS